MTDDPFAEVTGPVIVEEPPTEQSFDVPPVELHVCEPCGDPIIREPGSKGRWPKYHPDCRPSKQTSGGTSTKRTGSRTKAEREADECVLRFKSGAAKTTLLLAILDPYDAMAVSVGTEEIAKNLRAILIRHDGWRRDMLMMAEGGSIIGLIAAVTMTALPILAHHGLIPNEKMRDILVKTPQMLVKLNERLSQGQENLTAEFAKLAQERETKKQGSPPSANGTSPTLRPVRGFGE